MAVEVLEVVEMRIQEEEILGSDENRKEFKEIQSVNMYSLKESFSSACAKLTKTVLNLL